jgi:hypothetical protein
MSLSENRHYKTFMDWLIEADVYMKWAVRDRFGNFFKKVGKDIYRRGWNTTYWRRWKPSNRYTKRRIAEPYRLRSIALPFSLAKGMMKSHQKNPLGRYEAKFRGHKISLRYVSGSWDIGYRGVYASFPDIDKHRARMLEFARLLEHLTCDDINFTFKENK